MMHNRRKIIFLAAAAIITVGFFIYLNNNEKKNNLEPISSNEDMGNNNLTQSLNEAADENITLSGIIKEVNTSEQLTTTSSVDNIVAQEKAVATTSATTTLEALSLSSTTDIIINIAVPFTTQAPLVKWDDPRQQDGCEEAVAVMAMAWVKGEGLKTKITPAEFEARILALSDFQAEKYGEFRDTSLSDMEAWIFRDYFSYEKTELKAVATTSDIISELEGGKIVLLPMAGRELKNPNFKAPGPLTHMILIKGYDYQAKEFITNDPGTRLGADYRYPSERIYRAIWVYPTGYHQETKAREKMMLIVSR